MDWVEYIFFSVSKQNQQYCSCAMLTTDCVGEISLASVQSIKCFAGTTTFKKSSFFPLFFLKIQFFRWCLNNLPVFYFLAQPGNWVRAFASYTQRIVQVPYLSFNTCSTLTLACTTTIIIIIIIIIIFIIIIAVN